MTTTIRVDGIKETIRELGRIDPNLRKEFNANVKEILAPIVQAAQQTYSTLTFPSGTQRRWAPNGREIFPLDARRAIRGVKPKIGVGKRQTSTILVTQTNAGAAVFEFASSGGLGSAFNRLNGSTPRVMWPAADRNLPTVTANMEHYVQRVMDDVNGKLI